MSNLYGYNSSSAYKLDDDYKLNTRTANGRLHENSRRTETKTKAVAEKKTTVKFSSILKIAICFAVAFVIVNGYVKINEAYSQIAKLEKEYNDVIATNQDLQVKIDKAIDLEQLQTIVSEKYGMARPERYQMFYIDMEQGDVAKTFKDEKKTEKKVKMSGVTGTITSAMNIFK